MNASLPGAFCIADPHHNVELELFDFTASTYEQAINMARLAGFNGTPHKTYFSTTKFTVTYYGYRTEREINAIRKKIATANKGFFARFFL